MNETILVAYTHEEIAEILRDHALAKRGMDPAAVKSRVGVQMNFSTRRDQLAVALLLVPVDPAKAST